MNVILIGFMGSGKTTIGKALSRIKGMELIDTDELIERNQSITIKEIFQRYGEARFREIERDTISSLEGVDGCIISVGGGAVMREENFSTLKRIGTTVFLDAPFDKIIRNLKGKFRPLVGNTIDEDNLRKLLDSRYPTYKKADVVIDTDKLNVEETVEAILRSLE